MQNYVNLLPVKLVLKYRAPLHEKAVIYFYSTEMLRSAIDVTGQCIMSCLPEVETYNLHSNAPLTSYRVDKGSGSEAAEKEFFNGCVSVMG